jgi:hypothetical protein
LSQRIEAVNDVDSAKIDAGGRWLTPQAERAALTGQVAARRCTIGPAGGARRPAGPTVGGDDGSGDPPVAKDGGVA